MYVCKHCDEEVKPRLKRGRQTAWCESCRHRCEPVFRDTIESIGGTSAYT
jgi:hypothetical protein